MISETHVMITPKPLTKECFLPRHLIKQNQEETIGQRVARLRKESGLTQGELADRLDITQTVVSDYENDVLKFNGPLIIKLSEIFKVSADQILGLRKLKGNGQTLRPGLFRRLKKMEKLKKRDQQALLRTIDGFLSSKVD